MLCAQQITQPLLALVYFDGGFAAAGRDGYTWPRVQRVATIHSMLAVDSSSRSKRSFPLLRAEDEPSCARTWLAGCSDAAQRQRQAGKRPRVAVQRERVLRKHAHTTETENCRQDAAQVQQDIYAT